MVVGVRRVILMLLTELHISGGRFPAVSPKLVSALV